MSWLRARPTLVQCVRRYRTAWLPLAGGPAAKIQTHYAERNMNRSILHLIVLLVLVVGGGWIIGASNLPGAWYGSLNKPWFTPPGGLFPIAWTVLYILIAIAGWRTYERVESGAVMQVWWGQLVLNFAWSPVFFTAHLMWPAFAIIAGMFV